jgi:hypothetical protein
MKLTTTFVELLIEDEILIVTYKTGIQINQEVAEKIVCSRLSFTGNKQIPAMILSHGVVSGKPTQIDPLRPDETDPFAPFEIDPLIPAETDPLKNRIKEQLFL